MVIAGLCSPDKALEKVRAVRGVGKRTASTDEGTVAPATARVSARGVRVLPLTNGRSAASSARRGAPRVP